MLKARTEELNHSEIKKKLTPAKLKKEYPFLKKTDSLALSNAQRNLERAFRNYFQKRAHFPKMKTKKSIWQSYTTNNQQHTIYFIGNQLKLPKLKSLVSVKLHRKIEGTIKSATISAKNNREFYVSILCTEEVTPLPKTKRQMAVVYCPQQLVQTNSELSLSICRIEELQEKIVREEKRLAIKAKAIKRKKIRLAHGKNYQRQKEKLSKLYQSQFSHKKDYMDRLSFQLVKNYDQIFLEYEPDKHEEQDCNFPVSDWHHFLYKIQYKADWYGKEVQLVQLDSEDCQKMQKLQQKME